MIVGFALYFGLYDRLFYKLPTIVFDLDGTLQDSTEAILNSFKDTFRKYGNEDDFTLERQKEVLGPPIYEMFKKYFPNLDTNELCDYYRECNKKELEKSLKPMPNAIEVVNALKEDGYKVAILTTRMKESTKSCLKICGFGEFDDIITFDDVKSTKPNPEGLFKIVKKHKLNGDDLIMIGDSKADVLAGQSFGAYTVAYLSHEGKKDDLIALKPNRTINDLKEILDIVKEKHYFTYNEK